MQRSSFQKPVEGNPCLAEEQLSCLGRAASLLRLEDAQGGPCTGAAAAPLLPLASPPVPKSHHPPPGCQEHLHTEIHVMFPSSLPASNLCCPSEKSTFLVVKFRISLVLWLALSPVTTFSPCSIYFALRHSSRTFQLVFVILTQSSAYVFNLKVDIFECFSFSLPPFLSPPPATEAHKVIVFC